MGMSIRFCIGVIGVLAIAFAAVVATVIGSVAAMGEAEAIARGLNRFVTVNWREIMSFGPAGCVVLAFFGGVMLMSGLHRRSP